ncbi:hypothetical protein [Ramlibacter sp.]|uniref:hypothetical protein n=1 Tax=Ramlibacter sp. TaxID=1917967 RepID=UPI003D124351
MNAQRLRRLLWHPLHPAFGLGLWALWFVAAYGGVSVLCSTQPSAAALPPVWVLGLGALCIGLAAALGGLSWASARAVRHAPDAPSRFVARLSAGLDALAAVATLAGGLPLRWLPPCV